MGCGFGIRNPQMGARSQPGGKQTLVSISVRMKQKSQVLLLGSNFRVERGVRVALRGSTVGRTSRSGHCSWGPESRREDSEPAPSLGVLGALFSPRLILPTPKSSSHCPSLEALSGGPRDPLLRRDRKGRSGGGTPLSDGGQETGGTMPSAAGNGRPSK